MSMLKLAAVALLSLLLRPAYAVDPTQGQIDNIYALTYGLVAYNLKLPRLGEFPAPTVYVVPLAQLCVEAQIDRNPCPLSGLTVGAKIYLSAEEDWSKPEAATIILHEYVHYFQNVARGEITGWCENYAREIHAYAVQAEVLRKIDSRLSYGMLRGMRAVVGQYEMARIRAGCDK